jgi:hypothetical protein
LRDDSWWESRIDEPRYQGLEVGRVPCFESYVDIWLTGRTAETALHFEADLPDGFRDMHLSLS